MNITPRIHQILNMLLDHQSESLTDQKIADRIGVSKRTILRDMDEVSEIIQQNGLVLERKKGEGSRLVGKTDTIARFKESLENGSRAEASRAHV